MADLYKTHTSYSSPNYNKYPPPSMSWGGYLLMAISGLIVIMVIGYKILEWWDGLFPYAHKNPYHNYPKISDDANIINNTDALAKPTTTKWANTFKPKPVVAPKVYCAGRMGGIYYESEGLEEAKYLNWSDKNRYFSQKHISFKEQKQIENEWDKTRYNG